MPYFFQSVAAHPSEIVRDYVMLSLLTGQRQANVLAMEWSELDLTNSLWRIPRSKTKTTREYVVPLVPEVIEILQRRREAVGPFSRFVLPGSGRTGHFAEAKGGWKRILLRAQLFGLMNVIAETGGWSKHRTQQERQLAELAMPEAIETYRGKVRALNVDPDKFVIKDLRMHDLRRTLASWQAITGANIVAISKTLNHSNVATTSIYARMQTDPVRQAISTAAGAMFEAGGIHSGAQLYQLEKEAA
jgi:integrase